MFINRTEIGPDCKPYVIAEIGNNAFVRDDDSKDKSLKLCKTLIARAAASGASAVKLQKRDCKSLFAPYLYDSPYINDNSFGLTYGQHREALEFNHNQWASIFNYARFVGITLFATAFDIPSADFLETFDPPAYKIASGCLKDIPLITYVAKFGKPMIISTGGSTWSDVDRAHYELKRIGVKFCFLHCTMEYPTEASNLNLRIITSMIDKYPGIPIGFSDHTIGTWAIPAAYSFGACIFEKHFTTNKSLPGPDHVLSVEPNELQDIIHTLDRITAARGTASKRFLECERNGYHKMGKGWHAARDIAADSVIAEEDVRIQSPAVGVEPYYAVIGRRVVKDVWAGSPIFPEHIK